MNKYFTTNDEFINRLDDFILPPEWWSRPFEYNWCSNFLEKNDTILDAACGIEHPFKFYAANRCKKVYAIDIDKDIEGITNTHKNLVLSSQDISATNFDDNTFDKIFCISVLEHVDNPEEILKEFHRVLKPKGLLILTCDYPLITPENLGIFADRNGFISTEEFNYNLKDKNILKGLYNGLRCFRMLLQSDKKEIVKEKKEKKTKNKSMKKDDILDKSLV